jgi:hypothetical protein
LLRKRPSFPELPQAMREAEGGLHPQGQLRPQRASPGQSAYWCSSGGGAVPTSFWKRAPGVTGVFFSYLSTHERSSDRQGPTITPASNFKNAFGVRISRDIENCAESFWRVSEALTPLKPFKYEITSLYLH